MKVISVLLLFTMILCSMTSAQVFSPTPVPYSPTNLVVFKLNYPLTHLDINNYPPSTRGLFANHDIHFRFYTRQEDWTQSNLFNEVRWDTDLDASNGIQWSDWEQNQDPGHYAERVIQFPHGGKYTATVELRWTNTLGQSYSHEKSYELYVAPSPTAVYGDAGGNRIYYWVGADNVLDRPSFLVEGFDPANENTPEINYALGFDLIQEANSQGYDLFIMDWANGGVALETTRDVFLGACDFIHSLLNGREAALQVVGISMGGTVARYGLAWAEDGTQISHPGRYIEHYVNTFISFDGPQQGAHFNTEFQNLVKEFGNGNQQAIINSTAARQMLYDGAYPSLHTQLYHDMNVLHNDESAYGYTKGYPRRCMNLAVSNGNRWANYPDKSTADDLATITIHGQVNILNIQTIPVITKEVHIKAQERDLWPGSTFSYDLSSLYLNGFKNFGRFSWGPLFADAAASWRFQVHFNPGYTPTESALDLDNYTRAEDGSIQGGTSWFDQTLTQTTFQRHEVLTPESKTRVMQWLNAYRTRPYLGRPSGLREGNLLGSVTFTDHAAFEEGFKVERRPAVGAFSEIATLPPNMTQFVDNDPARQPYATYYYRVKSYGGGNYSRASEEFAMVYRPHLSSSVADAFNSNAQRKLVRTSCGSLVIGYEGQGRVLRTVSTNDGIDWENESIVGDNPGEGTRFRNLNLVLDSTGGTVSNVYEEVVHDNEAGEWQHRILWDGAPYVPAFPSGVSKFCEIARYYANEEFDPMPVSAMTKKSASVPALFAAAWRTPGANIMLGIGTSPYVPDLPVGPQRWTTKALTSNTEASHPSIAVVAAGSTQLVSLPKYQVFVAWQEPGDEGGIRLVHGTWTGGVWPPQADEISFTGPYSIAGNTPVIENTDPVVTIDGGGNLAIAWAMVNSGSTPPAGNIKFQIRSAGNISQVLGTFTLTDPEATAGYPIKPSIAARGTGGDISVAWTMSTGGLVSMHYRNSTWGPPMHLDPTGGQACIEQTVGQAALPGKVAYSTAIGPPFWIRTISDDPPPPSPVGLGVQPAVIGRNKHPRISWQPVSDPDISSYRLYRYICLTAQCNCGAAPVCIAVLPSGTTSYVDQQFVLWQKGPRTLAPTHCVHYFVRAVDAIAQLSPRSTDLVIYANENLETGGEIDGMEKRAAEPGPERFELDANFPNPFNPATTLRFAVPEEIHVTLRVYDVIGREVATLVDEVLAADWHERVFDGSTVPSGVYYCRMTAGSFSSVRKLILLK